MIVDKYGRPYSATDSEDSLTRTARFHNPRSGAGTKHDKNLGARFIAQMIGREEAETIYRMSWAARKLINTIVEDMFFRWRRWIGDDGSANEAMEDAEQELKLRERLPQALTAGRLFGSSLMIICTDSDKDFETELDIEAVKEGSLSNLWVVDRWAVSIENWYTDPTVANFGDPYQFLISSRIFGQPSSDPSKQQSPNLKINKSRTIRFNGMSSPLTEGWISGPWEREWGVSILTPAVEEILRDTEINAAIGQLVDEASVWVQKLRGFKETIKGRPDPSKPSPEEIAEAQSLYKSLWRVLLMDIQDEADRVNVPFTGLPDIMDKQAERLAMIGDIPVTRFKGTSAEGLNATGDGDARDWRTTVYAQRENNIDPVLQNNIDPLLAKHAGLAEPPPYEWIPFGELTEEEKADIEKVRAETMQLIYGTAAIDENEIREVLSGAHFDLFDELEEWPEDELARNQEDPLLDPTDPGFNDPGL